MDYVLLGFMVFNTIVLLFTVWLFRQARKAVDRMHPREGDPEWLRKQPP